MEFSWIKEWLSRGWALKLMLVIICLTLYLPHLAGRDLWAGRETLYAQVARETLEGNWLVLHFNGELYSNKPPLYFWVIALISKPWGDVTEFTLRLPSALAAIGTVLVVYALAERLLGAGMGFLAGVILATSPEFQKYACVAKLEMPLTFFLSASLTCFYIGLNSVTDKRWYFLWGWVFLALSVLTKGLGVILIPPVIGLYLASRRELHRWKEMEPLLGSLIFMALLSVWLLPALLYGGLSYTSGVAGHLGHHMSKPFSLSKPVFYIKEILVGTLPWSLILVAIYFCWRDMGKEQKESLRFPLVWFLVIFIIFSLVLYKRSRYLLPLYPSVALMLAALWNHYIVRPTPLWRWELWGMVLVFGYCGGSFLGLVYAGLPISGIVLMIALSTLGLTLLTLWSRQYKVLFGSFFLFAMAFETYYCQLVLPKISHAGQERAFCQELLRTVEPGTPLATYEFFNPDYVWYTRRRIQEISSQEALIGFLSSKERVYCLIVEKKLSTLEPEVQAYKIKEFPRPGRHGDKLLLLSNKPDKEAVQ